MSQLKRVIIIYDNSAIEPNNNNRGLQSIFILLIEHKERYDITIG